MTAKTASDTYLHEQERIATALESLKGKLDAHAVKASGDLRNWGYAGDLSHIRELLERAEAFLSGSTA